MPAMEVRSFRRRQLCRLGSFCRGGFRGSLPLSLLQDERIALARDLTQGVHRGAGTGGDQTADDDVLLESLERVDLAVDGGFGEHARGLLERRRRDERPGLQRRFGDSKQHRMADGLFLAFGLGPSVDLVKLDLVDLLALDELGFTSVVDLYLLQHLADDHLDMLVVDGDALQPVHVLDFVDEIGGQLLDTFDCQDVVRSRIALDDGVAFFNYVAVLQVDMFALGNQIFLLLHIRLVGFDDDATFVLVVAPEPHRTGDFRDDGSFLRSARFEQLRHPRQTARDIAGFRALCGNACDHVARLHVSTRIDRDDRIDGKLITGLAAAGELHDLVLLVLDHDGRTQVHAARGAPIDNDALGDAGRFIESLRHRLAFDQILKPRRALDLGEDGPGVGVPFSDALAAIDLIAVFDQQTRAVLDAVHRALRPVRIEYGNHHVACHGDGLAIVVLDQILVRELDRAVEVGFDNRMFRDLRRAADVEGAHGQLGAGLADGLRRDDADGFAHVDGSAAGKIAPVAFGTDAIGCLAGEHRTDAQLLHARSDDRLDLRLLQQSAALDDHLV